MADASKYVVQFKLTPVGAANLEKGENLIKMWRRYWIELGGSEQDLEIRVTLGDYDFALFGSIANDAKVAAFGLAVAMEGSATTSSHRTFTPVEAGMIQDEAIGVHRGVHKG